MNLTNKKKMLFFCTIQQARPSPFACRGWARTAKESYLWDKLLVLAENKAIRITGNPTNFIIKNTRPVTEGSD